MNTIDLSTKLNPEQLEAAKHREGPLLVLAGAGSGKTRCLTYRIVNLIQSGISASSILALTFTNKAAKEMKERVETLSDRYVLVSTFHSLGAKILRESAHTLGLNPRFVIYDEEDSQKLIKNCLKELELNDVIDAKSVKSFISQAKNALFSPEESIELIRQKQLDMRLGDLYECYQKKIMAAHAVDFDDLLYLTVKLLTDHPEMLAYYQSLWQFFLVDEYQDTNEAQYEMIRLLSNHTNNLFVVGDPDQSIYSWRGANINNILNFEKDYSEAKTIVLEQNYRSTETILNASNDLITHNIDRLEKNLWSDLGQGEKIKEFLGEDEYEEASFVAEKVRYYHEEFAVPLNDITIFYRTNFQSRVFEDAFLSRSIPYKIIGGLSFYQRREVKDLLAYLKLAVCPTDTISFLRVINVPKRGIGAATVEKILHAAEEQKLPIANFCKEAVNGTVPFKLTARQKKGIEQFVSILNSITTMQQKEEVIGDIITMIIETSGYLDYLATNKETEEEKKGNIYELVETANHLSQKNEGLTIDQFLEEITIHGQSIEEDFDDTVSLMTLHNGKGLEFTVVFIVGLDNDLLPHANSRDSYQAIQEERRLFYVGITRAKKILYFSHVRKRSLWGQLRRQYPSSFLKEISQNYIEKAPSRRAHHTSRFHSSEEKVFYLDECDEEEEKATYKPGDAVMHKSFGVGIIKNSYQASSGEMVDVLFANEPSVKSLVVKFAKLKRL